MTTQPSHRIRKLLVLGALFGVLLALTHVTHTTSATVTTPMTVLYFDPGSDGAATAWLIAGCVIALTLSWPLVTARSRSKAANAAATDPAASSTDAEVFPNYLQLRSKARLSPRVWSWLRYGAVIATLIYVALLIVDPDDGLWLWWQLTVPLLPALFLIAPGVWRNVCPLAASNQLPRVLNFSRALNPPKWLTEYGFVIGAIGFFAFASSRKWLFNHNGPASGILILFALVSALLGGYVFKGKSGWCSSICPLYPLQRFYNRTPFATVPNAHCSPCVGCTKNCYDFKPGSAYIADLYDDDRHYASYRKFFAAAMPGFIVAYFTLPDPKTAGEVLNMYLRFGVYMVLSIGVFTVLDTFLKQASGKLTALYGAIALNLFYGFGLPNWLKAVGTLFNVTIPDWPSWVLRAVVLIVTIVWVVRTFRVERRFLEQRALQIPLTPAVASTPIVSAAPVEITFLPGDLRVPVEAGRSLLEIAEANKQPIKSGCRMGVCGADPILIADGQQNLPPMSADEKATLERLGLGPNCRLACMCKPTGSVTVSLDPKAALAPVVAALPTASQNPIEPAKPIEVLKPVVTAKTIEPAFTPSRANPNDPPMITFMPTQVSVPVDPNCTLLEMAECHEQPIEAGCRMGICGADPVLITEGMENLPPLSNEEKSTLDRLGLGPNCRLACMCRPKGSVTVALDPKNAPAAAPAPTITEYDRNIKSVVIIGNGAAGITAADYVRRNHPDCEIHLISREKHAFYNRMAITRLIYGRSAMSGLYMQSEQWYEDRKITCWLNTHATHINRGHKQVELATGETLTYDRLILASGSSSFVPPIQGYGQPGSFVLREAEDAMEIRAYVQKNKSKTAVIAGGGLLGLETAYALHKMGLSVWVLERGEWLLRRQLDEHGGQALKQALEALGLIIETNAETAAVHCEDRVCQVELKGGRTLPCDVFIVAVGIQPNIDLAQAAGLHVNRGVIVDELMRTSAPDIFAAGDVTEFEKQVPGLWAVAVEQAKVAAINAVGGHAVYEEVVPVTMLKVAGVDVTSMGRFERRSETEIEIAQEHVNGRGYRKLVVADGKLIGAILVGDAAHAQIVSSAVKERRDVSRQLDALNAGHWDVLSGTDRPSSDAANWIPARPIEHPAPIVSVPAPAPLPTRAVEISSPRPQAVSEPNVPNSPSAPFDDIDALQRRIQAQFMAELAALKHTDRQVREIDRVQINSFRTIVIDFKKRTKTEEEKVII
ncbi:MAG: FAD-dependent oxidoreductase [Anaerolineae bacterium]